MGQSLLSPASIPLKIKLPTIPTSFFPTPTPKISPLRRNLQTKALLSETKYPKVAAQSTGPIPAAELLRVVESAAEAGAEVVMEAVNKPRNINYKGVTDLVTDTDKMSESVILDAVKKNFKDHLILGEEGGLIGDTSSDYLWCIDPLDGTTNFAHCYPSFAVSVGVLFRGKPAAASVVEFVGGPMCWDTRTFSASSCGGAFCNGQKIHVSQTEQVERSLLVTGFGYEHDDAWATNINLFKEFTDISRILEEAGGVMTRMDGGSFSVFDRPEWMTMRHHQGRFSKEVGEYCGGGLPHALQHSPFSSFFPCKQSIPMKTSKSEIISKSKDMVWQGFHQFFKISILFK